MHQLISYCLRYKFCRSTWIIVADGGLEETLAVLGRVGRDDFEAGALRVPGGEALRVLGCHARRRTVRATEHHWHWHLEI